MKKSLILATSFAMALGVGVAVGAHHMKEVEVKADTVTTMYLDTNKLTWYGDQSRAYLYGDGGAVDNTWPGQPLTLVSGSLYKLEVTNITNYDSVIFLRSNGTDVWNRTSKHGGTAIALPADWTLQNKFTFDDGWNGNEYDDGNYTGAWSLYTPPAVTYDVTVHVDNKGTPSSKVVSVAEGDLPADPDLVYGDAEFEGWYTANDYKTKVTEITADCEVYGKVVAQPTATYGYDVSKVSSDYEDVYLYAFQSGNRKNHDWPGVELTESTFEVPTDATLILNAGQDKAQTVNVAQLETPVANDVLEVLASQTEGKNNARWASTVDEPAEDGYYLLGSKTSYKYAGAPKIPELAEPDEDNNVAILEQYDAKTGEKYKVKFFKESTGENTWSSTVAVEGLGTLDEDGNFVMSKDATINIYVKWESSALKFYVSEYHEPEPADDPAEDGYYLVGTKTNWKYAGATKLAAGENGNRAQLINYSATAGEEFQVRSRLETVDTWYGWGEGHNQNYVVGESNKQLDIYVNGEGHLWVQEHVEPDIPAEDGYYICGLGSFRYEDATKMIETTAGGNVAYYSGLSVEVNDEIRVRSYFNPRLNPEENVDQWATCGTTTADYGELHGDNFKFSKAGSYDVYAKYEDGFKFFVAEHVDNFTIEMTAVKFNGKVSEGIEAMANQLAYITEDFEPQNLEKSGYVMNGVYEEETLETPYTPRKFATNGHLYVKYMKVGFYALSAAGLYELENADPMMTEGIAETNKAEVLLTVKANDCYSFVEYKADGTMAGQSGLGDGIPAGLATYESDEFGGHVKFLKDAVVSVYLGNDNKVYLNEGLTAFLTNFISDVGGVCSTLDGPGYEEEAYIASLQAAWGRQKVAFNALSDKEQKEIKDAEYGPKAGEDDLSKMINKYYYIVEKYGTDICEDFIWKLPHSPKVGNSIPLLSNSTNTGLIIIISVSAISVISIAALLMLKKRKEK